MKEHKSVKEGVVGTCNDCVFRMWGGIRFLMGLDGVSKCSHPAKYGTEVEAYDKACRHYKSIPYEKGGDLE